MLCHGEVYPDYYETKDAQLFLRMVHLTQPSTIFKTLARSDDGFTYLYTNLYRDGTFVYNAKMDIWNWNFIIRIYGRRQQQQEPENVFRWQEEEF